MDASPALTASQASWRCVQAGDKEGWLDLMAEDVLIEDPIGPSVTNPDGAGARGKAAVGEFFDRNIAGNRLTVTCEETFPSSSPLEVAHILVLRAEFPAGGASTVRGAFTYRVREDGLLAAMRGYWRVEDMTFEE
jgi:steroid delta-isomerase